jgi:cysteinyl-tRNA synthetase
LGHFSKGFSMITSLQPSISLYNTRTRTLQPFIPADPARVTLYVCGPTVYNFAHLGNARPPVLFGLLARVLKRIYPGVIYARNITDVDDKINAAAIAQNVPIHTITEHFTEAYRQDTAAVGADQPDIEPKATAHVGEIITMCEQLIASGHAYAAQNHVLFNVASYADYGKLSGRSVKDMIAGARVEVAPYKKNPADFVLWKPSTPELPGWESPWGRGRPGWHIECSAMCKAHLGETLDIHAGGNDLMFPHHENEVAQSTCAHGGKLFANFWLHNGMLTVNGAKMSKSLGNTLLIDTLRKQYAPEVLRYFLLSGHYRQPLDWSDGAVEQAKSTLDRLYTTLRTLESVAITDADLREVASAQFENPVFQALCQDLNTPVALAELNGLAKTALSADLAQKGAAKARFLQAAELLGFLQTGVNAWFQGTGPTAANFDALLAERESARAAKNFQRADAIRKQLLEQGVVIDDTASGAIWKRV